MEEPRRDTDRPETKTLSLWRHTGHRMCGILTRVRPTSVLENALLHFKGTSIVSLYADNLHLRADPVASSDARAAVGCHHQRGAGSRGPVLQRRVHGGQILRLPVSLPVVFGYPYRA